MLGIRLHQSLDEQTRLCARVSRIPANMLNQTKLARLSTSLPSVISVTAKFTKLDGIFQSYHSTNISQTI